MPSGDSRGDDTKSLSLHSSQISGDLIEHAIDVTMGVCGAKLFCQRDRFIDDDFIGHIDAISEFEGTEAQQISLDRVELFKLAIEGGREERFKGIDIPDNTLQYGTEVLTVSVLKVVIDAKFSLNICRTGPR